MSGRSLDGRRTLRGVAAACVIPFMLFPAVLAAASEERVVSAEQAEKTPPGKVTKDGEAAPAAADDSAQASAKTSLDAEPPCRPAPQTLEDIYGDTGEQFQAGVGMVNFEKAAPDYPDPVAGYGVAVDDMVIEWREFNLVDDNTDCALGGECAVIDLQTVRLYEGSALVSITVLEKSPPVDNDCDFDDLPDGTGDCDSDGIRDLPVKATTEAEPGGEIVYANLVAGDRYSVELAVSVLLDVEGVLFAQPIGVDLPTVSVLYMDLDDGTGQPCANDVDVANHGRVEASLEVIVTRGNVVVESVVLSDNGDDDGWADTNETVQMQIVVGNKTGVDLTGVTARLMTADPRIDCILDGVVSVGDIPAEGSLLSTEAFVFKVADVQRQGTCSVGGNACTSDLQCVAGGGDECDADLADFSAELTVNLASNEFDAATAPQTVTLDLDLNAAGGSGPGSFHEGFESGTFGSFTTMNLDEGLFGPGPSDGYRCQYSDPDWWISNSYGQIFDCWLGATAAQADKYWWQTADGQAVTAPIGRSFEGRYSAYMGYWDDSASAWTTPLAIIEALATQNPIHIGWDRVCEQTRTQGCASDSDCVPPVCPDCIPAGESCVGVTPELSFKHQISLTDSRATGARAGRSVDGGAISVRLADPGGTPVGDWVKIEPYVNVYDQQRDDFFTNCFFDPIDDGNTEDDFFVPSDPDRRLGPSTLCFPEFVFGHQGDTDSPFSPDDIGRASDGPGLAGATGDGTWVETRFNLQRFRGRSLRLRFVHGSIKAGSAETMETMFGWNPIAVDDGWWVDDVTVRDTLAVPATVSVDVAPNTGLPGCGEVCNSVSAALVAAPGGALVAPGQVVELSAVASTADRCLDGTLQYRFWIDGDQDGLGGGAADSLLRGWTDNPVIPQAPELTTRYAVEVRCTSLPTCAASASLQVVVNCPATELRRRELGVFGPDNPDPEYQVGWLEAFSGSCSDNDEEFCTVDADCDAGTCVAAPSGQLLLSWPPGPDKGRRVRITRVESGDGTDFEQTRANGQLVPVYGWELQVGTGFRDPTAAPPPDGLQWFLVTHDDPACNVGGSWQTGTAAEPGRDNDLP